MLSPDADVKSFSIVINTDGRAKTIGATLSSLLHIDYPRFEVCVVIGPTADGTEEIVKSYGAAFKIAHCSERNLSKSRNIGIAMAAGDIVAFIDDDAIPEPEWLRDLAVEYRQSSVGAVGGFVYDNTGVNFQSQYVSVNRLGRPFDWHRATPEFNFPMSAVIPHLLGTNSSFLRAGLLEIGGFDEEYEYFLDETDVLCRLLDRGYEIIQSDRAFVHHKFAESGIRDSKKIVRRWYPLIKNRVYFALKNASFHYSIDDCIRAGLDDVRAWTEAVDAGYRSGLYSEKERRKFDEEISDALRDGTQRGLAPSRRLLSESVIQTHAEVFRNVSVLQPLQGRKTICFISQDYPPNQNGGIARYISQLATALGRMGHNVHVITKGSGHDRLDYEDNVWVHRVIPKHIDLPHENPIAPEIIPQHIWNWSNTALSIIRHISDRRRVDLVYAPIWDCEGIAVLLDKEFHLVTSLQTTMNHWLDSYPEKRADEEWMRVFGKPILSMERLLVKSSWRVHSISRAIAKDVEALCHVDFGARVLVAPIGLSDWGKMPAEFLPSTTIKLLFVGRLESRKGIDILLEVAPRLLAEFPEVILDIVGDDTISIGGRATYRSEFEGRKVPRHVRERIHFHGRCDEDALQEFYKACDIFVAPSRYESFGLISLEAMMCAKPVVACRTGGMPEVVIHGETGLLAEPADTESLYEMLKALISDATLRAQMGKAGRARYELLFTAEAMAHSFLPLLSTVSEPQPVV